MGDQVSIHANTDCVLSAQFTCNRIFTDNQEGLLVTGRGLHRQLGEFTGYQEGRVWGFTGNRKGFTGLGLYTQTIQIGS